MIVVPPASEPVTLDEAKAYVRIDHDTEDDYIATCISAAREYAESHTGRAFVTQTRSVSLDAFPDGYRLDGQPIQSIEQVTYVDDEGAERLVDESVYRLDANGRVFLAADGAWPTGAQEVVITYDCGYGEPEDVPAPLRQAILFLVAHWYNNREPVAVATIASNVPFTVDAILSLHRVVAV